MRRSRAIVQDGLIYAVLAVFVTGAAVGLAIRAFTPVQRDRIEYHEYLIPPGQTRLFKFDWPPCSFYFKNTGAYEDWSVVLRGGDNSYTARLPPGQALEVGDMGFTYLQVELERSSTLTDKAREVFYRESPEHGAAGPLLIKQNHVLQPKVAERAKREGWLKE